MEEVWSTEHLEGTSVGTPTLPLQPVLEQYEREAAQLVPQDDATERGALLFIAKCRSAIKSLTEERRSKTDPLRAEIERLSAPYALAIQAFERLQKLVEQRVSAYRQRLLAERAEAQRRALAEAARQRAEAEAKAAAARAAAEQARLQGLEAQAIKQEAKAAEAEQRAATIVPPVIPQAPKTVTVGDAKITLRKRKDWCYANGLPRGVTYYRTDPRFADLPDEVWKVDEAKIGQLVRAGATIRGIVVTETTATSVSEARHGQAGD